MKKLQAAILVLLIFCTVSAVELKMVNGTPVFSGNGQTVAPVMSILSHIYMPPDHLGGELIVASLDANADAWKLYTARKFTPPYTIEAELMLDNPVLPGAGALLRLPGEKSEVLVGLNATGNGCRIRISGAEREYFPADIKFGQYVTLRIETSQQQITVSCNGHTYSAKLKHPLIEGPFGISVFAARSGWKNIRVTDQNHHIIHQEDWNGKVHDNWQENNGLKFLRQSYADGIRVFQLYLDLGGVALKNGGYDFSDFDSRCRMLLRAAPGALIISRTWLDSGSLLKQENRTILLDRGGNIAGRYPWSFSDPEILKKQQEFLRSLIEHVDKQDYAPNFAGVLMMSGDGGEFTYHFTQDKFADYSDAHRKGFIAFLRKRYRGDLESLNRKWKRNFADFKEIPLPSPQERIQKTGGSVFVDETSDAGLIDFMEFHSRNIAERINTLAATVKKAGGGKYLAGVYYGYTVNAAASIFNKGHNALAEVLRGEVDFLVSPYQYYRRTAGNPAVFQFPEKSVTLNGKFVFLEDDSRTVFCRNLGEPFRETSLADSIGSLRRNFLLAFNHRSGLWYLDWGQNWFMGPLSAEIRKFTELYQLQMNGTLSPGKAEVAVIIDEDLLNRMYSSKEAVYRTILQQVADELGRCGAPFDTVLHSDLSRLPPYKFHVYPVSRDGGRTANAVHIPPGKRIGADELRQMMLDAGVHIYNDQGNIVYAGENWVGIHLCRDGAATLNLPSGREQARELFSGIRRKITGNRLIIEGEKGSTQLWQLERADQNPKVEKN